MLRASLSRPLLRRQFSISSSAWNSTRSPLSPLSSGTSEEDKMRGPPEGSTQTTPSATAPDSAGSAKGPSPFPTHDSPTPSLGAIPQYDLTLIKQRIREWSDQAAITVRNRADDFTATTKITFSQLGSHLNKATGYEEIDALKKEVVEQEVRINATRQAARDAKVTYDEAVVQRSNSQREVNDLLQRKSNWTDGDVSRFTTLVRQDHLYEQEEARAKTAVEETEAAVEREFSQLMRTILARYHEEQVWSDKIRSASTYGSLAALGLNLLVFLMAIVVVEPWKRRRLAQTFEDKVEELARDNATRLEMSMGEIGRQLVDQENLLVRMIEGVSQKVSQDSQETPYEVPHTTVAPEATTETTFVKGWKLAAVATSAFAAGILSSLVLGR